MPEVAEILQQAARGLNAAHKLGIIHRDLKPDNIFLTRGDDESVAPVSSPANVLVKIVDFGIAKLRESGAHTQTGMVLGTPAYMSFEQASGMRSDELDARSDVYSLGVVVYEMLTGRTPFHSDTPLGYVRKHMTEDPPPFRSVASGLGVPPALESVVMKALVKDRDERYASALDFSRAFGAAAEPVAAPEVSQPLPSTRIVLLPTAQEPVAAMAVSGGAPALADIAVQTPPPAVPQGIVETPRPRSPGSKPVAAASPQPAVPKPPEFAKPPKPPSKVKFVAIWVVALILIVAAAWYFSPSANPPVSNPQGGFGTSQTGAGQRGPVVETPAPTSQSPAESEIDAADRRKRVEAAKSQGDNYYENGEYDEAINSYQEGLKLAPSNAQLLKALRRAQTARAAEEKFNQ